MSSDLLKNACFTVLKKKGDRPGDVVEPSRLLNQSPVVNLQINPSALSQSVNMYSRLPSLNERSVSPGMKASKEFSFFQGQSELAEKRKRQGGNSWVRNQPAQAINTKSYADEVDQMIAKNLRPEAYLNTNPMTIPPGKLEKLRQLQAQPSMSPRSRMINNKRNRSSMQFRHLGTISTDRSRDDPNTSSLAGASELDLAPPQGEKNTGFGVEKTITILQSIKKDKRRDSIFNTLIESYHKKDAHDHGFAELYEKFRQTSKKADIHKFGVPVAAIGAHHGANSNRDVHTLRYFHMAISAKINQDHEDSSPDVKFKQIQKLHEFVMKTCSDLIPSHYKEVLDFYAQVHHHAMHSKEPHPHQKKPNTARMAFGSYLPSTAVEPGEKHPFETGTPANPKLLKKNTSVFSQSQEGGKPMFQSSLQERFSDLAEELRVSNHRFQLLREEAALKERGLIVAFEKIKAKCLEMKRSQEIMISAYNKKCALINSLNERLYGEAAKAKLEAMWDDQTLKRIYGIEFNNTEDELLDMDIEIIHKSGAHHHGSFVGSGMELTQDKAEREMSLAKRKVLLKRYVCNRSESAELGQMRRKDRLNMETKALENLKNRLNLKDFQGETANLIWYDNKALQTDMSFADPKYDRILRSQPELDLYHQRTIFEDRIQSRMNSSNFMYFLTDEIIRSMFDKDVWDLSATKPVEVPTDQCELLSNLQEVDQEGELEDKAIKRNTVLKASDRSESMEKPSELANPEGLDNSKFSLERIEDYINFKVHLQMPMHEGLMKYLFISYLYVLFDRKKKMDLIHTRESQIQVLQDIISKHKAKLVDQDLRLMKYKQHVEVFNEIHRDCKVGTTLGDFISDPSELEPTEKEKKLLNQSAVTVSAMDEKENTGGDDANMIATENLMLRVWKVKAVSKEKNKKYMSFKFVYEKIYRFFQIRLQEVEFIEPNKVEHPYSLEEHFFRILTEKDVTVKKVEEKIKNFIVTLLNLETNPKLTLMKKFLKLMPGGLFYGPVEEYFYLRCMEYIKTESRGLEVPVNSQGGTNFVSFEKFEGYLNKYIHPRLNPKASSLLMKAVRGHIVTVADASLGLLAKKGLIDLDDAIEEVFKWVFAKSEQVKPMEHYMDLFAILDISFVGRISFGEFNTLYNSFSKRGHLEKGKLLVQLDNYVMENAPGEVTIHTQLDLSTFHSQLRSLKHYSGSSKLYDQVQKFSPDYVHSTEELRQLFYKNAIEGLDGTSEAHLTFLNFCNVMNEYEHLFEIDKILRYLNVPKLSMFEGEYFVWKTQFHHHYTKYIDFIQYSIIPDSNWRNNTLKRLGAIKDLFEDESKVYEDYKTFLSSIAAENSLNWSLIEPKLEIAMQIKTLLMYRFFLIDLMHVDFEQRVDFGSPIQLPETADLLVPTVNPAKNSPSGDKFNFSLTNLAPLKFLLPNPPG